jgi:hypothetical protein
MNLDDILASDRELTDEELAFVERELVRATRELHAWVKGIQQEVREKEPRLAARLGRSADSMLENVEKAASLPWPNGMPGALAD